MGQQNKGSIRWDKLLKFSIYVNAAIRAALAVYFFLIPAATIVHHIQDPGLTTSEIPAFASTWHRQMTNDFETWARERVSSEKATKLDKNNLSGTEWPIFSAVYYLWATEALQHSWEENPSSADKMPLAYAKGAVEAAVALITDPNHGTWVKEHWGDNYLYQENVYYRMLYISGLTSYQKLTGDTAYRDLLVSQVEDLIHEFDTSPYGLLDDYPGECYPIDILPAIAIIQRADSLLGLDHSAEIARAVRAFEDTRLYEPTGLPAYIADSDTGEGIGPSRGVGMSYMLIWAPELWPETAQDWYTRYEEIYWQEGLLLAGFRELPKEPFFSNWSLLHLDAGPVLDGYGTAASAFGLGAARANGHFAQAYPLGAEALLFSWPLPNGTLVLPKMLSNISQAPYLGETALLFIFTRTPVNEIQTSEANNLPFIIYLGISLYLLLGLGFIGWQIFTVKKIQLRRLEIGYFPLYDGQFLLWCLIIIGGLALLMSGKPVGATIVLLLAKIFPRSV